MKAIFITSFFITQTHFVPVDSEIIQERCFSSNPLYLQELKKDLITLKEFRWLSGNTSKADKPNLPAGAQLLLEPLHASWAIEGIFATTFSKRHDHKGGPNRGRAELDHDSVEDQHDFATEFTVEKGVEYMPYCQLENENFGVRFVRPLSKLKLTWTPGFNCHEIYPAIRVMCLLVRNEEAKQDDRQLLSNLNSISQVRSLATSIVININSNRLREIYKNNCENSNLPPASKTIVKRNSNIEFMREIGRVNRGDCKDDECLQLPKGCYQSNCSAAFFWNYDSSLNKMVWEAYNSNGNDSYVALGISSDMKMGDDFLLVCSKSGVELYVNPPDNGPPQLISVTNYIQPPINTHILRQNGPRGVFCSFSSSTKFQEFNLSVDLHAHSYFGLLTAGFIRNGTLERNEVSTFTSKPIKFAAEPGVTSRILWKLHGSFMVVSFFGFCYLNVFITMYRYSWKRMMICGRSGWLQIHRINTYSMIILFTIGLILILCYKGFSVYEWEFIRKYPHPVVGMCSTIFIMIQPIIGCFRPPVTKVGRRIVFYLCNTGVSAMILILGATTIYLAVELPMLESMDKGMFYIYFRTFIGIGLLLFVITFILTIMEIRYIREIEKIEFSLHEEEENLNLQSISLITKAYQTMEMDAGNHLNEASSRPSSPNGTTEMGSPQMARLEGIGKNVKKIQLAKSVLLGLCLATSLYVKVTIIFTISKS